MTQRLATLILAAGKGTRMKSDLPKVLHKVLGESMVSRVVNTAEKAGSSDTIVVIGHKKELVEQELSGRAVRFAVQEQQLGTGHAVMMAEPLLKDFRGDVLVLAGDVPLLRAETLKKLLNTHRGDKADATVLSAIFENPKGYGRIVRTADGHYSHSVEEKDADEEIRKIPEINSGIYVFRAELLFHYLHFIGTENAQGEYYLTDVLPLMRKDRKRIALQVAEDPDEIQGVNTVEQLSAAEEKLRTGL
ncbi:MAG: NTP transferase domain-containing protein [Candidatus Marinimicrobia bacterium]|jgi:bifunctional UDP-N-acetylglucosamine pyrophosphorylase/glucosamine-1-phosphate N-acetyltransferase|nr:NTP transferase domain-containing protein [Candidatus Neomarinimicrobiota bacterium]MDD4961870.1 NTP transferase domain-containing protein [Candidatus Neomarinimicrobiota bacterium]MDD5709019.1 NTP transferase domain-containing protein [Candidatus Neomarinimicrobiota bacterium]